MRFSTSGARFTVWPATATKATSDSESVVRVSLVGIGEGFWARQLGMTSRAPLRLPSPKRARHSPYHEQVPTRRPRRSTSSAKPGLVLRRSVYAAWEFCGVLLLPALASLVYELRKGHDIGRFVLGVLAGPLWIGL